MDNRVAQLDIFIQFVECDAAKVLEILLDFDFDVVAREIAAKLIAISAEFVRYRRRKTPGQAQARAAPNFTTSIGAPPYIV